MKCTKTAQIVLILAACACRRQARVEAGPDAEIQSAASTTGAPTVAPVASTPPPARPDEPVPDAGPCISTVDVDNPDATVPLLELEGVVRVRLRPATASDDTEFRAEDEVPYYVLVLTPPRCTHGEAGGCMDALGPKEKAYSGRKDDSLLYEVMLLEGDKWRPSAWVGKGVRVRGYEMPRHRWWQRCPLTMDVEQVVRLPDKAVAK